MRHALLRACTVILITSCSQMLVAQSFIDHCAEDEEAVFTGGSTLCALNSGFSADITIGTEFATNLPYTYWPPAGSDFAGKDILITGTFVINTPVGFLNSDVKFASGAKIVVWYNGTIWSHLSDFFSCDDMWSGIEFVPTVSPLQFTKGEFFYSRIEDAQYALVPAFTTRLSLIGNHFNRNYISIKNRYVSGPDKILNVSVFSQNIFDCTSALSDPYTGQSPDPGELSLAGIQLTGATGTFGATSANNTFRNMKNGILSSGGTFAIPKSDFSGMQYTTPLETSGYGIWGENSDMTITTDCAFEENATGAIYGRSSSMTISNCDFVDNSTGVTSESYSAAKTLQIINNHFDGNIGSSISVDRGLAGTGLHHKISENSIVGTDGHGLGEVHIRSTGPTADDLEVSHNHLSFNNKIDPRGISIQTISPDNISLYRDTITITDETSISGARGIYFLTDIFSTGSSIIQCIVTGDGYDTGEESDGLRVIGPNLSVCDNDVSGLEHGMQFLENCDQSKIGLNDFGPAYTGLHVNRVVGEQFRRGNTWSTEETDYEEWAALYSGDISEIENSRFRIHSNSAEYWAVPRSPNDWFLGSIGNLEPCLDGPLSPAVTGYDSLVIEGTAALDPARLWDARRVLMHKLLIFPGLRDDVGDFFTEGLDSIYGEFAIVDTLLRSALVIDRGDEDLLDSLAESIDSLLLHIAFIDSLQEDEAVFGDSLGITNDSLAGVKYVLLDSISILYTEFLDERNQIESDHIDSLAVILDYVNNITTNEKWQGNHQVVTEYRIRSLMHEPLSENGLDSLKEIANQCIEEAGMCVYQAVMLMPECASENYPHPEEITCPGEGSKEDETLQNDRFSIKVFPIPATDRVFMEFTQDLTGTVELYTVDGIQILSDEISSQKSVQLDISSVNSGLYVWKISDHPGTSTYGLVTIMK